MRKFIAEAFHWKDLPQNVFVKKVAIHRQRGWILVKFDKEEKYRLYREPTEQEISLYLTAYASDDPLHMECYVYAHLATADPKPYLPVEIHGYAGNLDRKTLGRLNGEQPESNFTLASSRYIFFDSKVVIRPDVQHPEDRGKKFRVAAIDHQNGKACIACYFPEKHVGENQWEHIDQLSKIDE